MKIEYSGRGRYSATRSGWEIHSFDSPSFVPRATERKRIVHVRDGGQADDDDLAVEEPRLERSEVLGSNDRSLFNDSPTA